MQGKEQPMLRIAMAAAFTLCAAGASAWGDLDPTNNLPNPYRSIAPWGDLPDGRTWGALSAVAIDNDGESVWVANRCGANPDIPPGESPFTYDSCAGSSVAPVMKFDPSGKLLLQIGTPGSNSPFMSGLPFNRCTHTALSPSGDIYVSDGYANAKIHKFSPDGKLIHSWGESGTGAGQFSVPHNVCCDCDGWV